MEGEIMLTELDSYIQSYLENWVECMARYGANVSSDKLLKHSEFSLLSHRRDSNDNGL